MFSLASAQIEATVDRTELTTDDSLQLTVTVTGPGSTRPPEMASLAEFDVLRSNISTNISIVNGNMQSQVVYQYVLQPLQAGNLTIPPVSVSLRGQDYQTEPINITVREGTGVTTPAADASFFVEAEVDTTTPFVGAQVLYTFRFFHAERISGNVDYNAPDVTGFWEGSRPEQRQYQVSRNGRRYNVTELQSALFPTRAGELTIGPAVLTIAPNFTAAQRRLETQPISLNVTPLPEPTPAGFAGAVGQFAISAFETSQNATQGEPIQVEVFVSGSSNIDTLPEPTLPILPEWRIQLAEVESDSRLRDGKLSGTKVFRYSLIPETFGRLTVPPFQYSY
ncbi:MAG: BatD family protein, partial [Deinococcota bacterium]